MLFYAEDITIKRTGKIWSGYAISRKNFDKWLASNAVNSGAKLLTSTELIDLGVKDEYNVTKAIVKTPRGNKKIKPKVVIAADGADSTVLKKLGFKNLKEKCGKVMSFEVTSLDLNAPNFDQIYIGDFAPSAYAYIFPISRNSANIGVTSLFHDKKLEKCYEEFLELSIVKKQIKNGIKIVEKSGIAPYHYSTDKWTYGNVLLVGDVANQNLKPFGEGILPAVICGDIAGNTVGRYISQTHEVPLDSYTTIVKKRLGALFKKSDSYITAIDEINSTRLYDKRNHLLSISLLADLITPSNVKYLQSESYDALKKRFEGWCIKKLACSS
jgi:flavin-dependent dehydrogenase